jgi:hypothetical protein
MFNFTEDEERRIRVWKSTLPEIEEGAIGGAYTYKFTPTSLGVVKIVERSSGEKLDLTRYEDW